MRLLLRLVLLLLLLAVFLIGVLFTLQNDTPVPLDLLILQLDAQWLALWVLLAFALGGLAGMLVGLLGLWRIKRERYSLKRQLQQANKELAKLRAGSAVKAPAAKA
ncbi:LapA family protein [Dasania sp. GY-MA-18]|uniref:LapA family protein n=1 Tax=Dasania phycosphaerae TaxID=2950436 RepID=A0A9J6RI00_9GAMM|nr:MULTISPECIES: LapA family protein [Dasania]MCR8921632.1 LapA family protein [Dasania sp. GY-MA-18]MCZ0864060.1 LapA family protein [Dasania phycosphaerae]MCZ0867788.1 LapA family protein [Dasania phycosphaerae]